jgi:hypothetical protein
MEMKKCADCGKDFEFKKSRYTRKYCEKCSAERKKAWDERWKVEFNDKDQE